MSTPTVAQNAWALARGFDLLAPHWDELAPVMQKAVTDAVNHAVSVATAAPHPDTIRLDALQQMGEAFLRENPEFGWKVRESTTGRGFRLSTTRESQNFREVRAALDRAMEATP